MQLIGMLDSPYVRRVAISMKLMGIPFEHQSVSVFRHFERFREINPVVKAPTLVCDDGTVLMDSTLILDYLEGLAAPGKRLMPAVLRQVITDVVEEGFCGNYSRLSLDRKGQFVAVGCRMADRIESEAHCRLVPEELNTFGAQVGKEPGRGRVEYQPAVFLD